MSNMLTLGQAAKLTGISKTTLRRAILDGRLPVERRDDWVYQISRSSLARLYKLTDDSAVVETVAPQPAPVQASIAAPIAAETSTPAAPRWREATPPRTASSQSLLQRFLGFFHLPTPAGRSS